jgi:hypothetical protein
MRRSTSKETAARAIALREQREKRAISRPRRKLKRQLFVDEIVRHVAATTGAQATAVCAAPETCAGCSTRPAVTTIADRYSRALLGNLIADAMGLP